MTRVTINIDLTDAKANAKGQINQRYNDLASSTVYLDQIYAQKKQWASAIVACAAPVQDFSSEATLRGISPADLAALILSKPNAVLARESDRQTILLKLEQASTASEIADILKG